MTVKREINIKPSCMSEIHGFPADQTSQLWEKINYLVEDPFPDGKLKKKIKTKGIYRLRVGDYRVFYNFGEDWVRLLGIRRRNEKTFSGMDSMQPDAPAPAPDDDEIDLDEAVEEKAFTWQFKPTPEPAKTPLPRPLDAEWLHELNIPGGYIPVLVACNSEEALLAAKVPTWVTERIIDNLFPQPLEEVELQPDLVVQDTKDLIRYKEGDLVTFLLKLDPDQVKLTDWALKGPTMVKGGAGTGKSTVALYRVKTLLEQSGTSGNERLLFATYTRALISASKQLLAQLLTPEQLARVRVATCDEIAREIVSKQRKIGKLASSGDTLRILGQLRQGFEPSGPTAFDRRLRAKALERLSDRYLLEEFDWIIDGRGLTSLEDYLETPRPGRGVSFRSGIREAVWELHQEFIGRLKAEGLERFADLRTEALQLVGDGKWKEHFDFVVVDEAQDLAPTMLRLMAEIAVLAEGLFFASDSKQSLYSRNYSWTSAHPGLRFVGRTAVLKRNYRSTKEIDRAAFDVLDLEEGETLESSDSIHDGPFPVLLSGVAQDEQGKWAAQFIRQMSRHLRMKLGASAVLVPNKEIGERIATELEHAGVPARFFPGRELNLQEDMVKVLTLHSAKGLEFPIVVVLGFEPGTYPNMRDFGDLKVYQERMRNERRRLYVGMTRAMRGLMLVVPEGCEHEALLDLKQEYWHTEAVA